MNKCRKYRKLLLDQLDNNLTVKEQKKLEKHLHNCDSCKNELSSLQHTLQIYRTHNEENNPPEYLDTKLIQAAREQILTDNTRSFWNLFLKPLPVSTAAVILLLVITGLILKEHPNLESTLTSDFSQSAESEVMSTKKPLEESHIAVTFYDEQGESSQRKPAAPSPVRRKIAGKTLSEPQPLKRSDMMSLNYEKSESYPSSRSDSHETLDEILKEEQELIDQSVMSEHKGSIQYFTEKNSIPPRLLKKTEPTYPKSFHHLKEPVTVKVEGKITVEGNLVAIKMISEYPMLRASVLKTLSEWKFEPGQRNGTPIETQCELVFIFQNND